MNPINMRIAQAGLENPRPLQAETNAQSTPTVSFREMLSDQMTTDVQFSKHAALRLNDRNIRLSDEQITRLASGIGKADAKGIRDSLVLVDNVALVVNVKSRTVITAMNPGSDNVFSNIDGAVIA